MLADRSSERAGLGQVVTKEGGHINMTGFVLLPNTNTTKLRSHCDMILVWLVR
jgi:hypothetical protein